MPKILYLGGLPKKMVVHGMFSFVSEIYSVAETKFRTYFWNGNFAEHFFVVCVFFSICFAFIIISFMRRGTWFNDWRIRLNDCNIEDKWINSRFEIS